MPSARRRSISVVFARAVPALEGILLGLNRSAMIGEIPLASPFRLSGP
jgi:hypothetical protein